MPAWDDAAIQRAADGLRLALDVRRRQRQGGARLGAGPGASLEFHDHRTYQPGDDLRHLDWGVYARTDQLVLRRHRREVSAKVDVIVDLSASVGITDEKAAMCAGLAALIARLGHEEGAAVCIWALTDRATRLPSGRHVWPAALRDAPTHGAAGLECDRLQLRPGSERILISDGLCPGGAGPVVRRLGRDAGSIALVEVMTEAERRPTPLGPVHLEDVEGGTLDLIHDEAACAGYLERLARHREGWRAALHGRGAGVIAITTEDGLDAAFRALVAGGLVEVSQR